MSDAIEIKVKQGGEVLPCGHVDSFEHRLVGGILALVELHTVLGSDPTDDLMDYVRWIFEQLYMPIPSMDEIRKIALARSLNQDSKEVN